MLTQRIPTVFRLNKLTLKEIFDRANMPEIEYRELHEGIELQSRRASIPAYQKKELNYIIACLIKNEKGEFDKLKSNIKLHNIDYKQMFRAGL